MQKLDTPKKKGPTFEEALAELEKIVAEMENGRLSLEESVERYTRGMELTKICRKKLSDAESKIRKLEDDGRLSPIEEKTQAAASVQPRKSVDPEDVPF